MAGRIQFHPLEGISMLRETCCADGGACDCFNCRPDPLTAAHVVAVYACAGNPLDVDDVQGLEHMTTDQLVDQLAYLEDFQG
jgi:hypothetical protein